MVKREIEIEGASPEEIKTWKYIHGIQLEHGHHINEYWRKGYSLMQDVLEQPVFFEDIAIPHWRVLPIDGKSDDLVFFDRLSKGIFNTNIYLRQWDERDYLPTRCRWHDSFGHLPHLYSDRYSDIMRQIGVLGKLIMNKFSPDSTKRGTYLKWITNLYWYTIEFGLIEEYDEIKAFGAGIISSPNELNHAVISEDAESLNKLKRFSLDDIIHNDFEVYDFQHTYYVLRSLEEIEDAILQLYRRIPFI